MKLPLGGTALLTCYSAQRGCPELVCGEGRRIYFGAGNSSGVCRLSGLAVFRVKSQEEVKNLELVGGKRYHFSLRATNCETACWIGQRFLMLVRRTRSARN